VPHSKSVTGIRECEIIQWFVEPEARVEEFDKICEVQSDKASVEIPSRFTGVIKKLHYESGEMAIVGKPLVDIDVQEDEIEKASSNMAAQNESIHTAGSASAIKPSKLSQDLVKEDQTRPPIKNVKHSTLATPAVRHLTKELDVDIAKVTGTGKDGRVMRDDVYRYAEARDLGSIVTPESMNSPQPPPPPASDDGSQKETAVALSNIQVQMFKSMTRSLAIPHFLYADEVDFSSLTSLRHRLNKSLGNSIGKETTKLSFLPFIIKAVSLSLQQYPILNARVEINPSTAKPLLLMRSQHNIGIAMDTPYGLLVPVIRNVSSLNILSIASELSRLQSLANAGKLTSSDLSGGTITVSNIGNIGGTYVSPVIVEKEVAILGIGRIRTVPAFDENGGVIKKQVCNFSWSADHRIVDGATMARAAEVVRRFVQEPDCMMVHLR
jgi:2-oxoisovalerate dehydrogenase E2 component (dihydrolipoyl transacylase)